MNSLVRKVQGIEKENKKTCKGSIIKKMKK